MGKYIQWKDVTARYRHIAEIGGNDEMADNIQYGESHIEGELAGYFTMPFSSNNLTAKDLCIDATFMKIIQFQDTEKYDLIAKSLNQRLDDLRSGKTMMAVSSGDAQVGVGAVAYSTTQNYTPSFDMNDPEDQWTDVNQQEDEYYKRI